MIVCDTSALVAILQGEPEAESLRSVLSVSGDLSLAAASYLEGAMVAHRQAFARANLDVLVKSFAMTFIPLDEAVARRAADAFARYGRGTGHPAALNFGDCISYATAKHLDCPLLFKGDDFRHTDVKVAL
ncbi:type II toxin-antitoxin system VapC family toxin [Phreatobacter sp.]|uniref:type II toxin-antitoxin system VapC family toxin n=1 Tax=Phreatobacter sp. TaxID=1966341 RepID=UPI0025FC71F1|nr:type II toxin-antitoxin system VapC family toxin [Phreatobacter sp.]